MKPMRLLSALFLALLALPALAADFEAGRDYHVFDEPRRTSSGDQVEITEFFAYSCPACRRFNGPLHDWYQQTERDVNLVRVPIPCAPRTRPMCGPTSPPRRWVWWMGFTRTSMRRCTTRAAPCAVRTSFAISLPSAG